MNVLMLMMADDSRILGIFRFLAQQIAGMGRGA